MLNLNSYTKRANFVTIVWFRFHFYIESDVSAKKEISALKENAELLKLWNCYENFGLSCLNYKRPPAKKVSYTLSDICGQQTSRFSNICW